MDNILRIDWKNNAFSPSAWLATHISATSLPEEGFFRGHQLFKKDGVSYISWKPSWRLLLIKEKHKGHVPSSWLKQWQELLEPKVCRVHPDKLETLYKDVGVFLTQARAIDPQSPLAQDLASYISEEIGVEKEEVFQKERPVHLRSNLMDIKKDALTWDRENGGNISKKIAHLLSYMTYVDFLEIDPKVNQEKLYRHLQKMHQGVRRAQRMKIFQGVELPPLSIRIRKMRRTKKHGFYMESSGQLFVDPRHMGALYHEAGHWLTLSLNECGRDQLLKSWGVVLPPSNARFLTPQKMGWCLRTHMPRVCKELRSSLGRILRGYPTEIWKEEVMAEAASFMWFKR